MIDAWMRILKVRLFNPQTKRQMIFGLNKSDDLNISVIGHKYLSVTKDTCTIKISNLTYSELVQIIIGKLYSVEVDCGYEKNNIIRIFKGGVTYASNSLGSIESGKTNTIILICASDLVAKYGQARINLTLNSGVNLYSATKYILKAAGIPNSNVSEELKKDFLDNITNVMGNPVTWLEQVANNNKNILLNTGDGTSSSLSVYDSLRNTSRIIKLNSNNIIMTNGHPQLDEDGVRINVLPTFNFLCGDVVEINNELLDVSVSSLSEANKLPANYLNTNGQYMIFEIDYNLQNRSSNFSLELHCKSRTYYQNLLGA